MEGFNPEIPMYEAAVNQDFDEIAFDPVAVQDDIDTEAQIEYGY